MECELAAQREQMAAKQREHLEEKERLKQLKVLFTKIIQLDIYIMILLFKHFLFDFYELHITELYSFLYFCIFTFSVLWF